MFDLLGSELLRSDQDLLAPFWRVLLGVLKASKGLPRGSAARGGFPTTPHGAALPRYPYWPLFWGVDRVGGNDGPSNCAVYCALMSSMSSIKGSVSAHPESGGPLSWVWPWRGVGRLD